jgi:nicotinamide-nucleotide amidase
MNAIILSIGDELALGQTVDTNSAWISRQLAAVGCDIQAHMTIPDNQRAIEDAIRESAQRCDFLIISGGIGPTEDDLTRQALAAVMGVELEMNEAWLNRLRAFFQARGREMPETNKIQAMIPRGARTIENTCGTAAGLDAILDERVIANVAVDNLYFRAETNRRSQIANRKCRVFVMPGVPKEMKAMFARDVLPHIQSATGGAVIVSRTLHTFGLGESFVAEKLGELMKRDRNPSVGTTVSQGIVSLRVNARFNSRDEAQQKLDETVKLCYDALGDLIFGQEDQSLAQVVATSLAPSRLTVTTAESCTGGLLAKMLTDISGSSDYFKTGFVTYSNESKHAQLGVPLDILEKNGAVSEPVVIAMATGALERAKANIAISISGIAGPTGGTPTKPVGTVCIALANRDGASARTFNFSGDREMIRDRSAKMALTMLRFHLLGKPLPF